MGITLSQNSIYVHATLCFTKTKGVQIFTNLEKKEYILTLSRHTTHFRQLSTDKVEKPAHVMETDFWVQSLTPPLWTLSAKKGR